MHCGELAAKPLWKSTKSLTPGKGTNKGLIELRGSSEERSIREKEALQSPGQRRSPRHIHPQLPPPETVIENEGFAKLLECGRNNRDAALITTEAFTIQGESFLTLSDGE